MESYEEWEDRYYNKKIINVMDFFKKYQDILKKLEIDIKEGEYTYHEYELLKMDILWYYQDEEDNEYTKSIEEKGVLQLSINTFTQLAFSYINMKEAMILNDINENKNNKNAIHLLEVLFDKKENYINEYV